MGHAHSNLLVHCIFSTNDRLPQIDGELRPKLFAYLGGVAHGFGSTPLIINGVADHVHLLLSLPATVSVSEAIRLLKANSSKWVHEQFAARRSFAWQTGYGAFSVSQSGAADVKKYIAAQEERHRTVTFQEEFVAFLERHGIAYDERYIWQ